MSALYSHAEDHPNLELIVRQININAGNNQALKESCQILAEYQDYVECVRRYLSETGDISSAVPLAVDECIENGILRDFLIDQRKEVSALSIYEFDEERYREIIREEAHESGLEEGRKEERANTARERSRAEAAEEKLAQYEARFGKLD